MRFVPLLLLVACQPSPAATVTIPKSAPSTAAPTALPSAVPFVDGDVHLRVAFPLEHACLLTGTTSVALPPCGASSASDSGISFFIQDRRPHSRAALMMRFLAHVYSVQNDEDYLSGLREGLSQSVGLRLALDPTKSAKLALTDGSFVTRATFHAVAPAEPDAMVHVPTLTLIGRLGLYTLSWFATARNAAEADEAISAAIQTIVHDDGEPWASIEQAVAQQRTAIRACYVAGLGEDPNITGTVHVLASVRADGTMARVTSEGVSGLPPAVEDCVLAQLRPLRMAPRNGPFQFRVPIALKKDPTTP